MINWEERYRELEEQMRIMLLQVANKYEELERAAQIAKILAIRKITINMNKSGVDTIAHGNGEDIEYSFAVYGPNGFKLVAPYSRKNFASFDLRNAGKHRVWTSIRETSNHNDVITKKSSEFDFSGK